MFQMNSNTAYNNRYLQFEGMIHYYRKGWVTNKWVVVYAKLWSDSTLEWFQSKGSSKPVGTLQLNTLIPYICVGPQVRKVPAKKPRIEATWTRDFLMAIAMDQKASTVHWFYFENFEYMRKWVSEMTNTLPRVQNQMNYPRQNNVETLGRNYEFGESRPYNNMSRMPMRDNMDSRGINMSFNTPQNPQKRSSFDSLFDESFLNYGIGNFFFPMSVDEWSTDSDDSDSDDDIRHRRNNDGLIFSDGNVHVSQIGDATAITLRSGSDRDLRNSNEFGSGFDPKVQVHRFEL